MNEQIADFVRSMVTDLFDIASEIDMTLKGGGIALPATSDRERRIYRHGQAVGMRHAAQLIERWQADHNDGRDDAPPSA